MKKAIAVLLIIASLLSSNPVSAQPEGFTEVTIWNAPSTVVWGTTFQYINDDVSLAFIQTFERRSGIVQINTGAILVSKTVDGGVTWSEPRILANYSSWGAIMPSPVYDPVVDKVFLLFAYWNGGSMLMVMESPNKGDTWHNEHRILEGIFYPLPSNASGIALYDGTLIFPMAYLKREIYYKSAALRSENHGVTWYLSDPIDFVTEMGIGCDEPAMVQLSNGALWALVRTNQGYIGQSFSYSSGRSWTPVVRTDFQSIGGGFDGQQAELKLIDGKLYMAYGGASRDTMNVGTLRMSENDGETWSDPINFEDGVANKGSFHISKMGAHQAILSWWEVDGIDWMGKAVIFDPDIVFVKPATEYPMMLYLPLPDWKKREYWPQPVLDPILIGPAPYVPPVH